MNGSRRPEDETRRRRQRAWISIEWGSALPGGRRPWANVGTGGPADNPHRRRRDSSFDCVDVYEHHLVDRMQGAGLVEPRAQLRGMPLAQVSAIRALISLRTSVDGNGSAGSKWSAD